MNWLKSMISKKKKGEGLVSLPFEKNELTVDEAVRLQIEQLEQERLKADLVRERELALAQSQQSVMIQQAQQAVQKNITASQLQQLAQSLQGASRIGPTVSSGTMHEDKSKLMHEYANKMPRIVWPIQWDVRAIPPFAGALVRYIIRYDKAEVSVYFDADNSLGVFMDDKGNPAPYWEVHPYGDDVHRVAFEATGQLVDAVQHSITQQQRGKTK